MFIIGILKMYEKANKENLDITNPAWLWPLYLQIQPSKE